MKNVWKYVKTCVLAAVFLLALGAGTQSEAAAPAQVSGLKQTDDGSSSVDISWDSVIEDDVRYKVELSADPGFSTMKTEETMSTHSYLYGLSAGQKYYVRVTSFREDTKEYGQPSDILEVVTTPQAAKRNLRQTGAGLTSITLKWDKMPGTNAYRLTYNKRGEQTAKISKELKDVQTFTAKGLSKDTEYEFVLYPRLISASGYVAEAGSYDDLWQCPVKPGKVSAVKASFSSPTSSYIDLTWEKKNAADGYQYEIYSLAGKKEKKIITGKREYNSDNVYFSSNKLAKQQFLKIRIRAYVVLSNGANYGEWSGWKYTSKQPDVKINNIKGGQKLSWKKVQGADSYTIWISKNKDSGYKKVKSITGNSITVKKCGKAAFKKGSSYYYRVVAYKKIGKKIYPGLQSYIHYKHYYYY